MIHKEEQCSKKCQEIMHKGKCEYLGCDKPGEILDDVEIAQGVIEKRYVCEEHKGQLVGNIKVVSNIKAN